MVFKQMMTVTRILLLCASLAASLALVRPVVAQNPPSSSPEPKSGQPKPDPQARITVEVTGGDQETPVENASVYFKYIEEHKIKKNKTWEWIGKPNGEAWRTFPTRRSAACSFRCLRKDGKPTADGSTSPTPSKPSKSISSVPRSGTEL